MVPERRDLDERFTLHPLTGEQVLERLLGVEDTDDGEGEDEPQGDEQGVDSDS